LPVPFGEIETALVEEGYWEGELVQRTREAGEVIVESRWVGQRGADGRVARILEINTDITERKRAEADARKTRLDLETTYQELVIANETRQRFLAGVSHELRTPLNAIIGFSHILLDPASEALSHSVRRDYLEHVRDAGEKLLGLVGQLLELSRAEVGGLDLHRERLSLAPLVAEAAEVMRPLAASRGVDLRLGEVPVACMIGDAARMRQIIYNLLSNALRFTPAGGSVHVEGRLDDGRIEISVSDTGPGIRREDIERIFRPFEKTDPYSPGAGLGLTIVGELVAAQQGTVDVQSTPGKGTTFTISLPSCD
jgi:signal transduction histidine kinase